jgi:hypothetical protein
LKNLRFQIQAPSPLAGAGGISRNPTKLNLNLTSTLDFRICPGRFLAENSLWLHVATVLACFNIAPTVGDDGKPIIPPREYTSGMVSILGYFLSVRVLTRVRFQASRPLPFPCRIYPRNDSVVDLIKDNVASLPESY